MCTGIIHNVIGDEYSDDERPLKAYQMCKDIVRSRRNYLLRKEKEKEQRKALSVWRSAVSGLRYRLPVCKGTCYRRFGEAGSLLTEHAGGLRGPEPSRRDARKRARSLATFEGIHSLLAEISATR